MINKKLNLILISFFCTLIIVLFVILVNQMFFQRKAINTNYPEIVKLQFEKLETVSTPEDQEKGLMNRDSLCEKCGMFFVFENEQLLTFWMKDTKISLDIIYLDKDKKVVKIYSDTIPNNTTNFYPSGAFSKYVLEVNAGYAKNNNITEGKILEL